ncbi:acyl carrier protein [Kineococcus sp. SYSU DK005]|uniref:acyl carrier protein n=1 Tax=Kineococcus sp. SYSU DK005 TaxID=3383126 RepID=UPI003D7EDF29
MDDEKFLTRFAEITTEVTGAPAPADLSLDTKFADLDMDSLDQLELLTAFEEEVGRRVPAAALQKIEYVRDIRDVIVTSTVGEEG